MDLQCCLHVCDIEDNIKTFSVRRSQTAYKSAKDWAELKDEMGSIPLNLLENYNGSEEICFPPHFGYHSKCYCRFTDKQRIAAAQNRLTKRKNEATEEDPDQIYKRVCRSNTNVSHIVCGSQANERTFSDTCILCRRNKYATCKVTSICKPEQLATCQSLNSDIAIKHAANEKNDTELKLLIDGEDLIAREAKYHKSCYKQYTYSYTNAQHQLDEGYQEFCAEVVEKRIVQGGEILSMTRLTELYQSTYSKNKSVQFTNYVLKRKLQKSHPDLTFLRVTNMSWSELVLQANAKNLKLGDGSVQEDSDDERDNECMGQFLCSEALETRRHMYHASNTLRRVVKESKKMSTPWPPLAKDLTTEAAKNIVPPELYNFIATVVGYTDELLDTEEPVELSNEKSKKVLSICQDLLYMSSGGRKPMPKHLALGMTVRHLSGCSELISILNGFGHCASVSTIIDYDSALAQVNINNNDILPPEIRETFTTLVYDNNDFGEETLSGKGTTHCTNAIIIQCNEPGELASRPERQSIPKMRGNRPVAPSEQLKAVQIVRKGPSAAFKNIELSDIDVTVSKAKNVDTAYALVKSSNSAHCLPGWTGFNTLLSTNIPPESVIGYLPVLNASPTKLEVVNEILRRCISIADRLKQEAVVLVLDQAIYSKAQQLRWLSPELEKRIVVRMGEFHTCIAFLAVIGKRFGDAGMRDIIIESNIVAEGSINGVLSGHHYNRSVRTAKLMYEALYRLLLASFVESLNEEQAESLQKDIHLLEDAFRKGTFQDEVNRVQLTSVMEELANFMQRKSSENPTFALWVSFIELVQILLLFLRATRSGDWMLHLSAIRKMLPWLFAYDRINYARYLTAYWLEMINLEHTHPAVNNQLKDGHFSVQRQSEHGFSKVAMDQTIEQTLNRDSKTKGGLSGITLNKDAVHRWVLSFTERAKIKDSCTTMANRTPVNRQRRELDESRIKEDERDVKALMETIKATINPFAVQEDKMVNITTGVVASADVQRDMDRAEEVGEAGLELFINQRMQNKVKDVFAPLSTQRLKTFSIMGKSKTKDKEEYVKANSHLLSRMLVAAKAKNMDMREVLSYSLSPVPPSLGGYDGSLAKTTKAKLCHHLEELSGACSVEEPKSAAWLVDGMAYIRQIKSIPETFGALASTLLHGLLTIAVTNESRRIDFVLDRYPKHSIKSPERSNRGDGHGPIVRISNKEQKVPQQFQKFLASGVNKEALNDFLFSCWKNYDPEIFRDVSVYLTHGEKCHSFSIEGVKEVESLCSDHEEADGRLILHTSHALAHHTDAVIRCSDTDVVVLAVGLKQNIPGNIYISMSTSSVKKVLDIQKICAVLPTATQDALIGLHSFTGCDTTSCFRWKGKIKAFNQMTGNPLYQSAFKALGNEWSVLPDTQESLAQFVHELYGQGKAESMEEARYNIFKTTYAIDSSLPPSSDELMLHTQRANYQAAIHRRALHQKVSPPSPLVNGWCVDNENLCIKWMTKPIAPEGLVENIYCQCKKTNCTSARCSCKRQNMPCTDLCKCIDCENCEKEGNIDEEDFEGY